MNLREQIELDLAETLEDPGGFGLPAILIDPDGVEHGPYYGQILYDTRVVEDAIGGLSADIVIRPPIVTLRRSSLARIPLASEKNRWAVKIPITPSLTADKKTFVLGHPSEDGASIGFIRLYLAEVVQS